MIPEEIKEEFQDSLKYNPKNFNNKNVGDSVRKSAEETDIDRLLKWANDLPDDLNRSSNSFYKKNIAKD